MDFARLEADLFDTDPAPLSSVLRDVSEAGGHYRETMFFVTVNTNMAVAVDSDEGRALRGAVIAVFGANDQDSYDQLRLLLIKPRYVRITPRTVNPHPVGHNPDLDYSIRELRRYVLPPTQGFDTNYTIAQGRKNHMLHAHVQMFVKHHVMPGFHLDIPQLQQQIQEAFNLRYSLEHPNETNRMSYLPYVNVKGCKTAQMVRNYMQSQ